MSIVLKKDGHAVPIKDFDEAQKLVNKGWDVWTNKTGKKLEKQSKVKKISNKKAEDK
tara:strand:- start:277 stop:447 length:171 start_codon:yes stop_codon:yes gene_type:complete